MREATWLTQTGKLEQATSAIQRALGARPTPVVRDGEAVADERTPLAGIFHVVADGAGEHAHIVPSPVRSDSANPCATSGTGGKRRGECVSRGYASGPNVSVVPSEAGFLDGSFRHAAGTRAYKLYVPRGCHKAGLRLVVMLHGCTQSPDDFAAGTGINALAEERACLVLYPAQDRMANAQKCWNWFKAFDQQRGSGEPALIAGLTQQIMETYQVDPRHVYVAGLSAGGAMAAVMGATYPDLYAAVGVHSGLGYGAARDLPSAMAAMKGNVSGWDRAEQYGGRTADPGVRPTRTIVFHGDRDTIVHPRNGDQIILHGAQRYIATSGVKPRLTRHSGRVPGGHAYTRDVYQDNDGLTFQEHWIVHGAGHAWSGGSCRGSHTEPRGPDASREMLRFFEEQQSEP
jgi:poly(hydroxyalkanoate) depolymerase family esterase